ncbi:hypothetical protein BsWGS_18357 [Bradybaena similaris]
MAATVSISHRVVQAITSGKWSGQGIKGFLVGDLDFEHSEPHLILGVWQSKLTDTNELKEEIDECLSHFAGGRNVVGVVLLLSSQSIKSFEEGDEAGIDREFEEVFGSYSSWLEQLGLTQILVMCLWHHCDSDDHFQHSIYTLSEEGVGVVHISHSVPSTTVARFRLRADIPVLVTTEGNTGSFKTTSLMLPLDVLVEVDERLPVLELSSVLNEAVARQIASMFHCLSSYAKTNQLCTPEVFHFKPACVDTPLTVVYAKGISDHELENERQVLHQRLCLPMGRPVLRRSAAGLFLCQSSPGGYLINTHIGLPEPPVKSATISLVDGYYSYHHYMQDHFDDNKWGCAYRSLQTIVSWFKYQGYTDRSIPNHRDIQQALFEVGDKDQKFVGSRQWIGSFEVSYVLDHLLGVTSKFINVNAGSELSSVGQELSNHFQTQGTPVMIGGGVLAHTILGVAYNDMTGDINFLILDPHYTGGEDLRTIQDKGWCGWKDVTFWNQTAHYNMCLPQRPSVL